jgi:hypothetical protein
MSILLANASDKYFLSTGVDRHCRFSMTKMNIPPREKQIKGKPDEGPLSFQTSNHYQAIVVRGCYSFAPWLWRKETMEV